MKKVRGRKKAFSLVEVTLALGVAGFCLIAVFGLLPTALNSNQTATQQTAAIDALTAVAADLRATLRPAAGASSSESPVYHVKVPQGASANAEDSVFYLKEAGDYDRQLTTGDRFRVEVILTPPASGRGATTGRILISWPPQAANPSRAANTSECFVALDRN